MDGYMGHSVLNVKALVGAFNQEKALVGAFSVIVKTDGLFAALPADEGPTAAGSGWRASRRG